MEVHNPEYMMSTGRQNDVYRQIYNQAYEHSNHPAAQYYTHLSPAPSAPPGAPPPNLYGGIFQQVGSSYQW